jgi:hypothetical protein
MGFVPAFPQMAAQPLDLRERRDPLVRKTGGRDDESGPRCVCEFRLSSTF